MWGKVTTFEWVSLAILALIAWIFPQIGQKWFRAIEKTAGRLARRRRLAVLTIGILAIVLRLVLIPVVEIPVPGVHDEFSYLLAADTFVHGRLANPPHPMWQSFESFHINMSPTYASIFPPGQGLFLAIGQLLGHPWIGVILSVALMCAAICWMLQGWMPAEWAFLGGTLAVLRFATFSYWINSYWGGAVAALGGALAIGALTRLYRTQKLRDVLILGMGLTILANSRPFEGFIFSIPLVIALAIWLASKRSPSVRLTIPGVILPLTILLSTTVAWMGYYNWRVAGSALVFPHLLNYSVYHSEPLFVWERYKPILAYGNSQFTVFYNTWSRAQYHATVSDFWRVTLNKFQNFWAVFLGPFTILPTFMLPWLMRDKHKRLLLIVFATAWIGMICVAWPMPHYAAPITSVSIALIVQAMRHLRCVRFESRPVGIAWVRASILMALITFSTCVVSLAVHPYRRACASSVGNMDRADLNEKLKQMSGLHLVLVRYSRKHFIHQEWVYNGADLDSAKVVWARELGGSQDQKLLEYYKNRAVWLVKPDENPKVLFPYSLPSTSLGQP